MVEKSTIWCEKYRPHRLKDLVGNQSIIDALLTYSKHRDIPNMLMTGSSGCGKTSAVQSLANECVPTHVEYLELNTSDERGIEMVRNKLKLFSGKKLPKDSSRIVFLDEADGMTNQAQLGLKALMDTYRGKVTFVLSCNNVTLLQECIISRCVVFQFEPIPTDLVCKRMVEINSFEGVQLPEDKIRIIAETVSGDLRSAINALQLVSMENPSESITGLAVDSRVIRLLTLKRGCVDKHEKAYRQAMGEILHCRARCEGQLGADKVCEILHNESFVHPELIRGTIEILLGKTSRTSTKQSDPVLSITRLLAVLRYT